MVSTIKSAQNYKTMITLILAALMGAQITQQQYDHKQLMETKHTEAAHYADQQDWNANTTGRLDRHAAAIAYDHAHKQDKANVSQPKPTSGIPQDDASIFGGL